MGGGFSWVCDVVEGFGLTVWEVCSAIENSGEKGTRRGWKEMRKSEAGKDFKKMIIQLIPY